MEELDGDGDLRASIRGSFELYPKWSDTRSHSTFLKIDENLHRKQEKLGLVCGFLETKH